VLAKRQAASSENELIFPLAWLDLPQKQAKEALEATLNRQYLTRVLAACHGNVTLAAKKADLDAVTFRAMWKLAMLPPLLEQD